MVYRFKLVSDEVRNFSREYEIDAESNFLQLRNAILESCDYSKDELDSFFLCNDEWEREDEITLEDMGNATSDQDVWLMESTPISELIEDEGQKLAFEFDYLTQRCFLMELKEIIPGRHLAEPLCTIKRGKAPQQMVNIEEFGNLDVKAPTAGASAIIDDLDIEQLPGEAYNDEDIEGFDIMDTNL